MRSIVLSFVGVFMLVAGCARGPLKSNEQALRPLVQLPDFDDDLNYTGLSEALIKNIEALKLRKEDQLLFGPRLVARTDYIHGLESLLTALQKKDGANAFKKLLAEKFEALEVYGTDRWGEVFLTSYFEPVIEGSKTLAGRFTMPLYGPPKDLVQIDLSSFSATGVTPAAGVGNGKWMPARLVRSEDGESFRVEALPDRAAILSGEGKTPFEPLVWVDPIDGFFLQIQGSGTVRLKSGVEMRLGYAAQNGHPYVAIGKFLSDKISKEEMSLQSIETHLRSLPETQIKDLLNRNPSYIFMRPLKGAGTTTLGAEVTEGRTIATDATYFPKGALAFLSFPKPEFTSPQAIKPDRWRMVSRFVVDQDTGGAIRGPGRVDLFWGRGALAKQSAGVIRDKGRLIYFVPR